MIRNFFKVVYRNLLRNKGVSTINIIGLAVGMAAAILILLWIQDERSYDEFHENKDRIYEVWNRVPFEGKISCWNTVSALTARTLENDLPEVERAVRDLGIDWHIVGVIKDFILTSPYEPTRPILICGAKSSFMNFNVIQVKLNGNNATAKNLEKMEAVFKKYNPD